MTRSSSIKKPARLGGLRGGQGIGVSEFKARCLQLLEETRQKGREWTITKKGEPVARVVPIRQFRNTLRGALKGLLTIKGDIVHWSSADDWEALR